MHVAWKSLPRAHSMRWWFLHCSPLSHRFWRDSSSVSQASWDYWSVDWAPALFWLYSWPQCRRCLGQCQSLSSRATMEAKAVKCIMPRLLVIQSAIHSRIQADRFEHLIKLMSMVSIVMAGLTVCLEPVLKWKGEWKFARCIIKSRERRIFRSRLSLYSSEGDILSVQYTPQNIRSPIRHYRSSLCRSDRWGTSVGAVWITTAIPIASRNWSSDCLTFRHHNRWWCSQCRSVIVESQRLFALQSISVYIGIVPIIAAQIIRHIVHWVVVIVIVNAACC